MNIGTVVLVASIAILVCVAWRLCTLPIFQRIETIVRATAQSIVQDVEVSSFWGLKKIRVISTSKRNLNMNPTASRGVVNGETEGEHTNGDTAHEVPDPQQDIWNDDE